MQDKKANETTIEMIKKKIAEMTDKDLRDAWFDYIIGKHEEAKQILKLIEEEQHKRGVY